MTDRLGPGSFMKIVNILGGDVKIFNQLCPLRERFMSRIGLGLGSYVGTPQVPRSHGFGVFSPSRDTGHGLGINVFPQAGGIIAVGF